MCDYITDLVGINDRWLSFDVNMDDTSIVALKYDKHTTNNNNIISAAE